MHLCIEIGVPFLRSPRAEALQDGGIERKMGMGQQIVDIIPTLQDGERIKAREKQLIILEGSLNRKQREYSFWLLRQIQPAGQLDQLRSLTGVPTGDYLIVDFVGILGMELKA